jgi:tetratricopeptide (TPR) repeat protein
MLMVGAIDGASADTRVVKRASIFLMSNHKTYKWIFPSRLRAGAYSWKSSRLACQRLREAVSEIKKVAKKDPVFAAEGAVRLMEKIWPALEHVDSSSGALGSAVHKALDALIPIVISAPADEKTRDKWLDRLWQAMADDGVDYLSPVGDGWGKICGSTEVAGRWADDLVGIVRACWTSPKPGGYFHGTTACLSCLLMAGRYKELLEILELDRHSMWHYRRYGVEALLALGRKAEAVQYAEASRGLNQPDSVIDQACEEILISSGMHEDAYQRYGLSAAVGSSYIARFRAVAKRYPMKDKSQILTDLIATTPGQEGKWFATAKELERYDLALELANRSPCDPKTLTRAARDYLDTGPEFALGSAMAALRWLSEGWGYEMTGVDVVEAYDRAMDAAARLNNVDDVTERVRHLLDVSDTASTQFVRQALQERIRAYLIGNSTVA